MRILKFLKGSSLAVSLKSNLKNSSVSDQKLYRSLLKVEQMLKRMKSNHFHIAQPETGPEETESLASTAI